MNIEILIIILIALTSFILLLKNFDLAIKVLLVLSTFLHKEFFSIYKWDLLPVRFFMGALGLYFVVDIIRTYQKEKNLKKYFKLLQDPLILVIVLLWIVRAVSIVFSKNLTASLQLLVFYTTIVALGIVLYKNYFGKEEKLENLIKFYIKLVLGLTLFGLFQLFLYTKYEFIIGALWNVPGHTPRIGSTFWDVNHFASLLACLLPLIGVFTLTERGFKKKAWYSSLFILMTGMLVLTSSRTSWIIALVSFLSFVILWLYRKFGRKGIYYLLFVIFIALVPAVREYRIKSSPFRAYIKENFHYRLDSFASHIMLIEGSYQIFEDYPILGGGYGSFFEHFSRTEIAAEFFGRDPAALNTRVPAHTIWGEALAETGIVGFSLLIMFVLIILGVPLFGALKLDDEKTKLKLSAVFSILLGVFMAGIFYSYNAEYFWLILFIYYLYALSLVRKKYSLHEVFEHFSGSAGFYLLSVLFISFALIFVKLGVNHLIPWDEAIYAGIAKNMIKRGDYINMFWKRNIIWYEKPPLMMWMMSFFMNLMGPTSLAARLPSAIFGFGTVALVFIISKRYFGKLAAYFSSFSLITGIHYLYYSRAAMIDVTTTFFITLSIYLYLLAKENKKEFYYLLSGFAIGLGVMTKGVIGFIPFFVMGAYDLYLLITKISKDWKKLVRAYLLLLVATLVVAVPWHAYMYVKYGQAFINNYFFYHVISRATQGIEEKGRPFFWYLIAMKVSMRVWFLALIGSLPIFAVRSFLKDKRYAIFTIWAFVVFMIFSTASSKVVWYIIPLYPAASIMVGAFASEVLTVLSSKFKYLKNQNMQFLLVFTATVFYITYLFFNKDLVYTGDLTGAEAELMQLKDSKLGTDSMFYIDRVPLPLVLYYTDSPYRIIDFEPSKGRMPVRSYDKRIVILGKSGRFQQHIPVYKEPIILGEKGDYILWYYESDLNDDKDKLEDIEKEISEIKKETPGNYATLNSLEIERQALINRISVFEDDY